MKKLISFSLLLMVFASALPAFADEGTKGAAPTTNVSVKNVQTGARNIGTGWVEGMDAIHTEASKGKNAPEHVVGAFAGGVVGTRKVLHRMGAGAIDLLTFWIPKKEPLIDPEKPRLQ